MGRGRNPSTATRGLEEETNLTTKFPNVENRDGEVVIMVAGP